MLARALTPDRRIPDKIITRGGPIKLYVQDSQWDELYPPVLDHLPLTGFMDIRGQVHYEINANTYPEFGGMARLKSCFNPRNHYLAIPSKICAGSEIKAQSELLGGGIAYLNRPLDLLHLHFLGLKPRVETPNVPESLRKQAIFMFQKSYNNLGRWFGVRRVTTMTTIIPDAKMQALGWRPAPMDSLKERWTLFKASLPGSLFHRVRFYEIILTDDATASA